jgi:uncharacterized protein involved in exopolysaccharide biosynthesis
MPHSDDSSLTPAELIHTLRTHVRWWAVPTLACTLLAALYALFAPRYWQATQALTVRPDAASVSERRLGKFSDLSEMKVLQATILELAKSPSVVEETLREVGPAGWFRSTANWPTRQDVEDFREHVDMRPPGGAEFGHTEVFYLSVRDPDRQRAAALVAALADHLERRMQNLRDDRAQSMITELGRTVAMAETDLAGRTGQLSTFEAHIGADLAELRNLNAMTGSQSDAAQALQAIDAERRANESRRRQNEQLLTLLTAAEHDASQLIATPQSLLQSQPALSRLKDALVDAQIQTADLLGRLADGHPFVLAARETEQRLQAQLHEELAVAIKGLEADLEFDASRDQALDENWAAGRERLARLAGARAEYANLVAAVESHTKIVESARTNLADARADQASAHSASVIGRIDGVEAGVRPVGVGRATITAAGGVAGLVFGCGIVFLFGSVRPTVESVEPIVAAQPHIEHPGVDGRDHTATQPPSETFGLFRGMTLDEAMRSVERRLRGSRAK